MLRGMDSDPDPCRLEIGQLYLSRGAEVNAIGGELKSTPLHWAVRQGHFQMIRLLMQIGRAHV